MRTVDLLVSQRKYEWESMSGRQLTLSSIKMEEMSKVEWEALQRLAIGRLQEMEISVSYGMLKREDLIVCVLAVHLGELLVFVCKSEQELIRGYTLLV